VEAGFVLVGLLLVGIVAWWRWEAKRRRQEAFSLLATQLGLQHANHDPFGLLHEPFAILRKGDGRGIDHVVWGEWQGMPLRAFDYWYYDESTDSNGHRSKTYYRFSCVLSPIEASCAPLAVEPENVFTRLKDVLTLRDIDFESEEFNRAFEVRCDDRRFAHTLIDARMIAWLLANGRQLSFEVVGDRVLCYRKRVDPVAYLGLFGATKGFRERIPSVVFNLYPRSG
jgi:hypothetical protein